MKIAINKEPEGALGAQRERKPKRLTSLEPLTKGRCASCFASLATKNLAGPDPGLQPLVCEVCHSIVHTYCQGPQTPVKKATLKGKQLHYFSCLACSNPTVRTECAVCRSEDGLLLPAGGEAVHLLCGLTHVGFEIESTKSISFRRVSRQQSSLRCDICKEENAYVKCEEKKCPKAIHLRCGLKQFLKTVDRSQQQNDQKLLCEVWNVYLARGKSPTFKPSKLFFNKDHGQGEAQRIKSAVLKLHRELQAEGEEQLGTVLQEAADRILGTMSFKQLDPVQALRTEVGGFVEGYCSSHLVEPVSCVCGLGGDEDGFIFCENCHYWYHSKCVGTKGQEGVDFHCKQCQDWGRLKKELFQPGARGFTAEDCLRIPPRSFGCDFLFVLGLVLGRPSASLGVLAWLPIAGRASGWSQSSVLREGLLSRVLNQCVSRPVLGAGGLIDQNTRFNTRLQSYVNELRAIHPAPVPPTLLRTLELRRRLLAALPPEQLLALLPEMQQLKMDSEILWANQSLREYHLRAEGARLLRQPCSLDDLARVLKEGKRLKLADFLKPLEEKKDRLTKLSAQVKKLGKKNYTQSDLTLCAELIQEAQALQATGKQFELLSKVERTCQFVQELSRLCFGDGTVGFEEAITKLQHGVGDIAFDRFRPLLQKYPAESVVDSRVEKIHQQLATEHWEEEVRASMASGEPIPIETLSRLHSTIELLKLPAKNPRAQFVNALFEKHRAWAEQVGAELGRLRSFTPESTEQLALASPDFGVSDNVTQGALEQARQYQKLLRDIFKMRESRRDQPLRYDQLRPYVLRGKQLAFRAEFLDAFVSRGQKLEQLHEDSARLLAEMSAKNEVMKAIRAEKKERKDEIKHNKTKPGFALLERTLAAMQAAEVVFGAQAELEKHEQVALQCRQAVQDFLRVEPDWEGINELKRLEELRDEADALRRQVMFECWVGLPDEVSAIYKYEIKVRVCLFLLWSMDKSKLDKCQKLLALAEEEGLAEQPSFGPLYQRFKRLTGESLRFSKEVAMARNLQKSLGKEVQNEMCEMGFAGCFAKTREVRNYKAAQLFDMARLEELPEELLDMFAGDIEYLQGLNREVTLPQPGKKVHINEVRDPLVHLLRTPIRGKDKLIGGLVERLARYNELLVLHRNTKEHAPRRPLSQLYASAKDLYSKCDIYMEEIEGFLHDYEQGQALLTEAAEQLGRLEADPYLADLGQMERIQSQWEQIPVMLRHSEQYKELQRRTLLLWVVVFEKWLIPQISYQRAKALLATCYEIIQDLILNAKDRTVLDSLRPATEYLEGLLGRVVAKVTELVRDNRQGGSFMVDFLDVTDLFYEAKSTYECLGEIRLGIDILRPFADLTNFYYERSRPEQEKAKERERERRRQQAHQHQPQPADPGPRKIRKEDENLVDERVRNHTRDRLQRCMDKNQHFGPLKVEQRVRMIENQIFGELHQDRRRYVQKVGELESLFEQLLEFPLLSAQLKKKNFQYENISYLLRARSNFPKLEKKMEEIKRKASEKERQAAKEQEEKHRQKELEKQREWQREKQKERLKDKQRDRKAGTPQTQSKPSHEYDPLESVPLQPTSVQSRPATAIDDLLGTAEVVTRPKARSMLDELDEISNKNSSRARDEHKREERRRSRSRSREREKGRRDKDWEEVRAEFSAGEEENDLWGDNVGHMPSSQPGRAMLFDPDAGEFKEEEAPVVDYPKGTILKIRSCPVQLIHRKKGKLQFQVNLLTCQHWKRLKKLPEPQFDKVLLRNNRVEAEIVEYLSRPRRKSRLLLGWFEAGQVEDNQFLRDFAREAEEKKRVFGIQGEAYKMHIMSSRQLSGDPTRFALPTRFTAEQVSLHFRERRLIFILQFPQGAESARDFKPLSYTAVPTFFEPREEPPPPFPSFDLPSVVQSLESPAANENMEGWGKVEKTEKDLSPITSEAEDSEQLDQLLQNVDLDRIQLKLASNRANPYGQDYFSR